MLRLDDIDERIVALLRVDGRATFSTVGDAVGLSAPAAKRRVDRLVAGGAITGFAAIVAPGLRGGGTDAFVEVFCRGRTNPAQIRAILEPVEEVVGAWTVTGDADALVRVSTSGTAQLEEVLETIRAHPQVERTRSVLVLSALLDR